MDHALAYLLIHNKAYLDERHIISGLTRRASEREAPLTLKAKTLSELLDRKDFPTTSPQKLDALLVYCNGKTAGFRKPFILNLHTDYPVCFAQDRGEFERFVDQLVGDRYLEKIRVREGDEFKKITVTLEGETRAEEIQKGLRRTEKAFIAMSFLEHEFLEDAYKHAFKPALAACGYEGDRFALPGSYKTMEVAILETIGRCGFMLADFTENRPSVYYEAGYAHGAGIRVVRTCHKDHMKDLGFDVAHFPCLPWKTGEHGVLVDAILDYVKTHGMLGPKFAGS